MRMWWLTVMEMVTLGCSVGCWVGCQPNSPVEQATLDFHILGGAPASQDFHQAVVLLRMTTNGAMAYCTGTLITPTVVLTAAHCVKNVQAVEVFFGTGIGDPAKIPAAVAEFRAHPGFDLNVSLDYDIGFIRLRTPAPAGIQPIPFLPHSLEISQGDLGKTLEFVGFGKTAGTAEDQGTRRLTVTANVQLLCHNQPGGCDAPQARPFPVPDKNFCHDLRLHRGVCKGDSGGPAFVERNSKRYLAGVTSWVWSPTCDLIACSTKIDEYESQIREFIGRADNGQGCAQTEDCRSGVCVSGICCDRACSGSCETCNRTGSVGQCSPVTDGASCADADPCNGGETCQAGTCQGGAPLSCDDGNACTEDRCVSGSGCAHIAITSGASCGGTETPQNPGTPNTQTPSTPPAASQEPESSSTESGFHGQGSALGCATSPEEPVDGDGLWWIAAGLACLAWNVRRRCGG